MSKSRTEAATAARNAQTARTFEARVEEVEWLRSFGIHPTQIAKALKLTTGYLEAYFDHAKRADLAALFRPAWDGYGTTTGRAAA